MTTEQELNDQLDELGREVADLYPDVNGAVIFDVSQGELKGIRFEFKRRPKQREKKDLLEMRRPIPNPYAL